MATSSINASNDSTTSFEEVFDVFGDRNIMKDVDPRENYRVITDQQWLLFKTTSDGKHECTIRRHSHYMSDPAEVFGIFDHALIDRDVMNFANIGGDRAIGTFSIYPRCGQIIKVTRDGNTVMIARLA